jgi:hypothetical protein
MSATPGEGWRYRPRLRPASRYTLPDGVVWRYVEAPAMVGIVTRSDLPVSEHRYGVIEVNRELTGEECWRFDLALVSSPSPEPPRAA